MAGNGSTSLDPLNYGTSTGGAAGSGETTTTLGIDRLDTRSPPDQQHIWAAQITAMKNLLLLMSQFDKGGTRARVLPQSSNPFGSGESGFYIDNSGVAKTVFNGGAPTSIAGTLPPYFAQHNTTCVANTNVTTTSFADIGDNGSTTGFANFSWTAPATQDYLIAVDIQFLYNPMGGGGGITDFRLLIDGTPVTAPASASPTINQSGVVYQITFPTVAASVSSGAHTLKVQCKTYSGNTVTFGSGYYRTITITG